MTGRLDEQVDGAALVRPHRPRRRRIIWATSMSVIAAAALLVGLHLSAGGTTGPLQNAGGLGYGALQVSPGQVADFPLEIVNTGSQDAVLESARLIPLPGFQVPRLVHLGIFTQHSSLIQDRGWPPPRSGSAGKGFWSLHPFSGYVVLPWVQLQRKRLGPDPDIAEYGQVGMRVGIDYWSGGLEVFYRVGQKQYIARMFEGGGLCVIRQHQQLSLDGCKASGTLANQSLIQLAG